MGNSVVAGVQTRGIEMSKSAVDAERGKRGKGSVPQPGTGPASRAGAVVHRRFKSAPSHVHRIRIERPVEVGGGFVSFWPCADCGESVNFRPLVQRPSTRTERKKYGTGLGWQPIPEQVIWGLKWQK